MSTASATPTASSSATAAAAAAAAAASGLVDTLPPPPTLSRLYTNERVQAGTAPPPPPPPADGTPLTVFGEPFAANAPLIRPLEELGLTKLYDSTQDIREELRRLHQSALFNFLELIQILQSDPDQYARKLTDLEALFINIHHILNEHRPFQAREQLEQLLHSQLEKRRQVTSDLDSSVSAALAKLAQTPMEM